jgi:hypothetical protein
MRNTSMDKLENTIAALNQPYTDTTPMEEEGGMDDGPMFEDKSGLDGDEVTKAIEEHLDSLPDDDKEFLAAHLSKELAKVIGIVTGSMELESYIESIANPKIALIPIPRDKAQAMMEKYKMMQSQPPQEGPPASQQPPVSTQPPGQMPMGVMGQPAQ